MPFLCCIGRNEPDNSNNLSMSGESEKHPRPSKSALISQNHDTPFNTTVFRL